MNEIVKKNILGVGISDISEKELLDFIFTGLSEKRKSTYVVTPNPEILMRARREPEFKAILNQADLSLCDGVGLFVAARILGKPLKARITGVEAMEMICKEAVRKPVSIGFLGGRGLIAERAAECLKKTYDNFTVAFVGEEWDDSLMANDKWQMIDILFVAFGFPKQEQWMAQHKDAGIYKIAIGVGGAFDYLSGAVPRAPRWVRAIGLEWLYRLIRQPWRWRRQLALLSFSWLVLKTRIMNRAS